MIKTGSKRSAARALLAAVRPTHAWKNVPVLAAPLFGHRLGDRGDLLRAGVALVAFTLSASAAYLVNDVADAEGDRLHPRRRLRPVAAGELSPLSALVTAVCLQSLALGVAFAMLPLAATLALAAYFALTLSYTFMWKHLAWVAPAAVASGFVLRVLVGSFAVAVEPSPWLLALTGILALALAVAKREAEARRTAPTLPRGLERTTDFFLAAAAAGYVAYTLSPATAALHHTRALVVTAPFVAAALVRFRLRLRADRTGLSPAEIVAGDPWLLGLGAAWAGACALLVRG